MPIVLAIVGLFVGAMATSAELFGALLGAGLGFVLGQQARLREEIAALRAERAAGTAAAAARVPAPTAQPAASPAPPAAPPPRVPATETVSPPAATPPPPSPFERALAALRGWFSEGNVPVKIGMLVLFVGVGALLNYAAEQGMLRLPPEFWLLLVAVAGVTGLGFGWRQRRARPLFALALQGGAIGVLLLTVFTAFRVFELLPVGFAFALILLLVAGAAALALLQNALALAVLASVGGFLAPVLVSTGTGNHVALFSYYAVLNAAIFAIAWVRPWRVLNLVGFGFTFAIGTLWGLTYYRPEHFASVEPFLILFFLFYVAIAVLYALRQPGARRGLVDGSLVFGVPLLAFALQAALLDGEPMWLAYSALAVALLYAGLATALFRREGLRTLALSLAALAIGFATIAVPLALDAGWTAATWALEGAALVWLGLRQQRALPVWAGVALQGLAGLAWLVQLFDAGARPAPFASGSWLSALLLAGSAMFSAYRLERSGHWPWLSRLLFAAATGVWIIGGLIEVDAVSPGEQRAGLLGFIAASLVIAAALRRGLGWARPGWLVLAGIGGAALVALTHLDEAAAPLRGFTALAWLAWLLASGSALAALRAPTPQRGVSLAHVAVLSIVAVVAGTELHRSVGELTGFDGGWARAAAGVPLLLMLAATWRWPQAAAAPLSTLFPRYRMRWFAAATALLALWWLASLVHAGAAAPLPFLPLANPLELAQLVALLLLWRVWRGAGGDAQARQAGRILLAGAAFVSVSVATVRAVHHLGGLAWDPWLVHSMLAQTSLTVVWSVIGVGAWILGSRAGSRGLWRLGAVLMGVVLLKLILVDREYMGNIAGIVSFLAVGVLLTVVGYFAPSPPARREA